MQTWRELLGSIPQGMLDCPVTVLYWATGELDSGEVVPHENLDAPTLHEPVILVGRAETGVGYTWADYHRDYPATIEYPDCPCCGRPYEDK